MKKLLLFLSLALFFAGQASSQTITVHVSGTVTRDSTGLPVSNHQVIIQADSNDYGFNFYTTRMTNPNGFYDCTIHDVPATGTGITFVVKTKNCDSLFLTKTFVGTTTAATENFVICNGGVPTTCEAYFQSHADSIQPQLIRFYDSSSPFALVNSWSWDFGDPASGVNNNSTVRYPVHIYTAPGTYTVCLYIGTSTGCTSHLCQTITVSQGNACEAAFHTMNDTIPGMIHFFDGSYPQGQVVAWQWNFGDGTPGSNLQNPDHIYSNHGYYAVCLTITSNTGCTSERCLTVVVEAPPPCQAFFHIYPDSLNPLNVHFFDVSSPAGGIASRFWTFGDGGTSTNYDPWHVYNAPGIYNVCLRITTTDSCTSEWCIENHVGPNPNNCESWFTYNVNYLTVHFEGHTHSQLPTTYTWYIGNPVLATLTGVDPSYTFPALDTYPVTLVTHDSSGCEFTTTQEIHLNTTYDVYGSVYVGNGFADHAIVDLIKSEAGAMTIVDTKEIADTMGMFFFNGVHSGHYYLKATLLQSSAYFGQYIPTYHTSSANWTNATLVELGQANNPYQIEMIHALNYNAGSGTISGVISQNAKMNGGGTPASHVEVLMLDVSGLPLSYTTTDAAGMFTFPAVAFGSYSIYPEITGKTTTPTMVTLSSTTPVATTSFTIQGNQVLGIHNPATSESARISEIFPNPVTDNATLTITAIQESSVKISVYYITGELAGEFQYALERGTNRLTVPVGTLSNSLYYVRIEDERGSAVIRKMVIRK